MRMTKVPAALLLGWALLSHTAYSPGSAQAEGTRTQQELPSCHLPAAGTAGGSAAPDAEGVGAVPAGWTNITFAGQPDAGSPSEESADDRAEGE
ncbi:hypothetical protein [Paenibacillus lutrae]|uniref:Uncharacterized protein n=1 Tax=Paenibacillus lutrae TaxID=2078573 RepID=A0A7X3FMP4_9BACL|nr:hypothetical protein [Paenibacillus lutrae]MVP02448.1 hypothetical protein [Paenibacillus lutrae]